MCVGLHGWNVTVDPYCSQLSICQAKLASSFFLPDSLAPSLACYCHPKKNFSEGLTKNLPTNKIPHHLDDRFWHHFPSRMDHSIPFPLSYVCRTSSLSRKWAHPLTRSQILTPGGVLFTPSKKRKKVQTYVIQTQSGRKKNERQKSFLPRGADDKPGRYLNCAKLLTHRCRREEESPMKELIVELEKRKKKGLLFL